MIKLIAKPKFYQKIYKYQDGDIIDKIKTEATKWTPQTPHQQEFRDSVLVYPHRFAQFKTNFTKGGMPWLYNNSKGAFNTSTIIKENPEQGNRLWNYLNKTNLNEAQKLAFMANSYHESYGWTTTDQTNGPAKGHYQMEPKTRADYEQWRIKNGYKPGLLSETQYIMNLFNSKHNSLQTPEDLTKGGTKVNPNTAAYRSYLAHKGYTTKQAWKDWESGDLKLTVKAFEALFERASNVKLDKRIGIADQLRKFYKK